MRVTFVAPLADRLGGSENMLWHVVRHAREAGLEPRVICLQDGPFIAELEAFGVPSRVIDAGRLRDPAAAALAVTRLSRELRRTCPDVVLSWMTKAHLYAAPAAVAAGLRCRAIWWQHGVPGGHWMDRVAAALPALAIGCSSHAVAAAQERVWPHRRTFVVHPGVEPPEPGADVLMPTDFGIPAGRPIVSIVGRLHPLKGQTRMVEAIALLRDRGMDVHLMVVGGDAHDLAPRHAREVGKLVDQLGLRNRATLTGQVVSAQPYMALSDIVVSASTSEGFGMVLVEAMMSATAVIAVDAGGPAEIIEPNVSGLLLADGRPATIADAIERLVSDPALRESMAQAGRWHALARFSAAAMTRRVGEELRALPMPHSDGHVRQCRKRR